MTLNVWIAALARRDPYAREVARGAAQGRFTWLLSDPCLKELAHEYFETTLEAAGRVASSPAELRQLLNAVVGASITLFRAIQHSTPVEVTAKGRGPFIVNDPSDDKFILCAIDGNADFIVTMDGGHVMAFFKSLTQPLLNSIGEPITALSPYQFMTQPLAGKSFQA